MRFEKIKSFRRISSFLAGIAITIVCVLFIQAKNADSYFEISKNLDIFTSIFKELNTFYVDPIEPGKLMKTGIDAMLDELDPYTNYISESDIEEYEFQVTGKYGGIGATMHKKEDVIVVGDVYESSPAQKAGLHQGDQVISIDNQLLKGKSLEDISQLLKGSPGTQVAMRIKDIFSGAESEKIITRGEIELSSVPYAGLVGPNKDVAYVYLTQFTPNCSRLVRSALDSLKGKQPNLKGVVLDLRNNPGGLLNEAVAICNIFVDRGQLIVSTKGKTPEWDKDFSTTGAPWDTKIPLAVLVNGSSASASEIVSGTMQDLDRGVIIGTRTYGKGLVQTTRSLGYNSSLKLTTAKYYTPSGRCIQAIDYSHRTADGSVKKFADSMKKTFATKNGRKVLSSGGIDPDMTMPIEPISKLAVALYVKNYFFDYATLYVKQHATIPQAGAFSLSDEDFSAFSKWLENKDYSYKTETEEALDSLKNIATREKYFDAVKQEYSALESKLVHDKKQDLIKNKPEITRMLENEIVSRYYFLRGRIESNLKTDNNLAKAMELINQPSQYQALLTSKK